MTFLLNHMIVLQYVCYVGACICFDTVEEYRLFDMWFIGGDGERMRATYSIVLQYVVNIHSVVFALTAFTGLISFIFFAFIVFQGYMIWINITTNEFFKWKDINAFCRRENHPEWTIAESPFTNGLVNNFMEVYRATKVGTGEKVERIKPPPPPPPPGSPGKEASAALEEDFGDGVGCVSSGGGGAPATAQAPGKGKKAKKAKKRQ